MFYIRLISFVAGLTIVLGIVVYITSLKNDLRTTQENLAVSESNNAELRGALETEKATLQQKIQEFSQIRSLSDRQASVIRAQTREIQALNEKFRVSASGAVRDLGKLALAKPGLVQDAINSGTSEALKCLENATFAGEPKKCE